MAWTCPSCGTYYEYGSLFSTCQTCEHRKKQEAFQKEQLRLQEQQLQHLERQERANAGPGEFEKAVDEASGSLASSFVGSIIAHVVLYAVFYFVSRWLFGLAGLGEGGAAWCGRLLSFAIIFFGVRPTAGWKSTGEKVFVKAVFVAAVVFFTFFM